MKKMAEKAKEKTMAEIEKEKRQRLYESNTWTDEFGVLYSADHKHLIGSTKNLKNYSIEECTEFIIGWSFEESAIETIHIPKSVRYIGENAFLRCDKLTKIEVEKENPVFDSRDNCNAIIETSSNTLLFGCKETIIPKSVSVIGEGAFCMLDIPNSFIIPKGVKEIKPEAFLGCKTLTTVVIPDSVVYIGMGAFEGCKELITVFIPDSVKKMDVWIDSLSKLHDVFEDCDKLQSIYIPEGKKDYFKKLLPEHSDLLKYKSEQ